MDEIERLRNAIAYNFDTGEFRWKVSSGRAKAGAVAGSLWPSGYVGVSFCGKRYLAHRLAWAFAYGAWPQTDVDHINQDKADNRGCNLRLATRSQNMANCGTRSTNKSGVRGVSWSSRSHRWVARVQKDGKHGYVGSFEKLEDAEKAVRAAYEREFGSYAA